MCEEKLSKLIGLLRGNKWVMSWWKLVSEQLPSAESADGKCTVFVCLFVFQYICGQLNAFPLYYWRPCLKKLSTYATCCSCQKNKLYIVVLFNPASEDQEFTQTYWYGSNPQQQMSIYTQEKWFQTDGTGETEHSKVQSKWKPQAMYVCTCHLPIADHFPQLYVHKCHYNLISFIPWKKGGKICKLLFFLLLSFRQNWNDHLGVETEKHKTKR